MLRCRLFVLLLFIGNVSPIKGKLVARIYEMASRGTGTTFGSDLTFQLRPYRSCFGRVYSSSSLQIPFSFDNRIWQLVSTNKLTTPVDSSIPLVLRMLCANNLVKSFSIQVIISKRNVHRPTFDIPSCPKDCRFFVPVNAPKGTEISRIRVEDSDSVDYNAQYRLELFQQSGSQSHRFNVDTDDRILLLQMFASEDIYEPIPITVVVCDFGSPQLCSNLLISIVVVTVTAPLNVRPNVATDDYQILEWSSPSYGQPSFFRVVISLDGIPFFQRRLSSRRFFIGKHRLFVQMRLEKGQNYTLVVVAVDRDGETSSDDKMFSVVVNDFFCIGRCSVGGRPACFYSPNDQLSQFHDNNGSPQCVCYNGYYGNACGQIETCPAQTMTLGEIGKIVWQKTRVNETGQQKCPYGPADQLVRRKCVWDAQNEVVFWGRPHFFDINSCRRKDALLRRMSVLGNYATYDVLNPESALQTLADLLRLVIRSAVDDDYIGRMFLTELDKVIGRDWNNFPPIVRRRFLRLLSDYSAMVGVAHSEQQLSSTNGGVRLVVVSWGRSHRLIPLGSACFVALPPNESPNRRLVVVWMRHASFFHQTGGTQSVLQLRTVDGNEVVEVLRKPIVFGLRPTNRHHNYTCTHFDAENGKWSRMGVYTIVRKDPNDFVVCETNYLSSFTIVSISDDDSNMMNMAINWALIGGCILVFIACCLLFLCSIHSHLIGSLSLEPCLLALFTTVSVHNCLFCMGIIWSNSSTGHRWCYLLTPIMQMTAIASMLWFCVVSASLRSKVLVRSIVPTWCHFFKRCIFVCGTSMLFSVLFKLLNRPTYLITFRNGCLFTFANTTIFALTFAVPLLFSTVLVFVLFIDTVNRRQIIIDSSLVHSRRMAIFTVLSSLVFVSIWTWSPYFLPGPSLLLPRALLFFFAQLLFSVLLLLVGCNGSRLLKKSNHTPDNVILDEKSANSANLLPLEESNIVAESWENAVNRNNFARVTSSV